MMHFAKNSTQMVAVHTVRGTRNEMNEWTKSG